MVGNDKKNKAGLALFNWLASKYILAQH